MQENDVKYEFCYAPAGRNGNRSTLQIFTRDENGVKFLANTSNEHTIGLISRFIYKNEKKLDEALHNIVENANRRQEKWDEFRQSAVFKLDSEIISYLKFDSSDAIENFNTRINRIQDIVVRNSLVSWIKANDCVEIDNDGNIIGFRGVDKNYLSLYSGYGVINGVEVDGRHDGRPGNVVEMPREMVNADPNVGCSFGLHIGTLRFATDWSKNNFGGGRVIKVAIHPEDVVAVAGESSKMRVCRYHSLCDIK